jgi:aspartate/methionine/tyrosine aminotransferase
MRFHENINNLKPSKSMSLGTTLFDGDIVNMTMGVPILNKKITIPNIEHHNYIKSNGTKKGLNKISELFFDSKMNINKLIITSGAKHGLFCLLNVLKIKKIANMTPSWLGYKSLFQLLKMEYLFFEKTQVDKIVQICRNNKIEALLIDNPSNPLSTVYSLEIINKLSTQLSKIGCLLIIDEVYKKLTFDNKYLTDDLIDKNIIRVGSLSKAYGAPGLRIGYVQSENQELIYNLEKFIQHSSSCIPEICLNVLISISKEKFNEYINETNKIYKKRFFQLNEILTELGLDVENSQSGFYLFAKSLKNIDLEKYFYEKFNILGISGVHYGADKKFNQIIFRNIR